MRLFVGYKQATNNLTITQIAKKLSRGCLTASNVVLKFKSTGSHHKKKRPGLKEKLSSRDQRKLARLIKSNRSDSIRHILGEYNEYNDCEISKRTLDRYRKKLGFSRRRVWKNQVQGKRHRLARVKWAVLPKGLTVDNFWKKVIFTDQCTIKVGQRNRVWVWKQAGEDSFRPDLYGSNAASKNTRFQVNVWGSITWYGQGILKVVGGTINAQVYI